MTGRLDASIERGCHVCGLAALTMIPGFEQLHRVTSDCKPWPPGGRLGVCACCGVIQKPLDEAWQRDAEAIYRAYTIYHQSRDSVEQAVFDGLTGHSSTRSARLLHLLATHALVPPRGRLLDVGCGNGALLRAASELLPDWQLAGVEVDNKYKDLVERIPAVDALYTCPPADVPGTFTLITLIHALEHLASPVAFLRSLASSLDESGLLMIEVPDVTQNPFDLLVADHASHFTLASLRDVVEAAGYTILVADDTWVAKELTVVARPGRPETVSSRADAGCVVARRGVDWLHQTADDARRAAAAAGPGAFGVFGTSIAATWLSGLLASTIGFYVDEDDHRAGRQFMNRPVYRPDQVCADAHVFVGLAPTVARAVAARLRTRVPGVTIYEPSALG